jgi:hypothetical protein
VNHKPRDLHGALEHGGGPRVNALERARALPGSAALDKFNEGLR